MARFPRSSPTPVGPSAAHEGRRGARHAARRRRSPARWLLVPLAMVVLAVAWVGVRGLLARAELETARAQVSEITAQLSSLDLTGASATYADVRDRTASARALTGDPVWRVAEWIPWLGRNFTVVRELAEAGDDAVASMAPLMDVVSTLDPAALAPQDGVIPLDPLLTLAPAVHSAAVDLATVRARADSIDAAGTLGPVSAARELLVEKLDQAAPALAAADALAPLLPVWLGSEGPRRYVVMFQNNAEARSLGGTALSFAVLDFDQGSVRLIETVPAGQENFPQYPQSVIPVPDGFDQIYPGALGTFIANSTLRPSFETAARIVHENWRRSFGVDVDGVIGVDGVALSYLLGATGPITLSTGDALDSTNVVAFLFNIVLNRYNSGDVEADNLMQDAVYSEAVSLTFNRLASGDFDIPGLASAMARGFGERRLAFWSSHEDEAAALAVAGLNNGLPASDEHSDVAGVYLNDNVGSKLSFFLTTALDVSTSRCPGVDGELHRLTLTVDNQLQAADAPNLSPSILGTYEDEGVPLGAQRIIVFVYAPPGANVVGASLGGVPVAVTPLRDTDRAVQRFTVVIPAGSSTSMAVDLLTSGERELRVETTPLVVPTIPSQGVLDCTTVDVTSF